MLALAETVMAARAGRQVAESATSTISRGTTTVTPALKKFRIAAFSAKETPFPRLTDATAGYLAILGDLIHACNDTNSRFTPSVAEEIGAVNKCFSRGTVLGSGNRRCAVRTKSVFVTVGIYALHTYST